MFCAGIAKLFISPCWQPLLILSKPQHSRNAIVCRRDAPGGVIDSAYETPLFSFVSSYVALGIHTYELARKPE